MIEWLDTNILYWHWIVAGFILIAIELIVPVFVLLWLGVSAIVVGILSLLLPTGFSLEILIWAVLSAIFLLLWHKYMSPRFINRTLAGLTKEAIIGQIGMVIRYSEQQERGMLKFPAPVAGNDEWEFIFSGTLQNGDKVRVSDISGNSLIVVKMGLSG